MTEFTVSVRELAAFCFRSGDIDHRLRPAPDAREGIEGHQRIYRKRPGSYLPEYGVELRCNPAGMPIVLRGRADGFDPDAALVEEIKTCRVDPATLPEALTRAHLAQARLYAALIAQERDLAELEVRLTWLHIDEDREYPLSQHYTRDELEAFLEDALTRFSGWLAQVLALRVARDASLASLPFPHGEFRSGQRDLAERVYKCIDRGGRLLLEAPTGIGKTAAVLYPALLAMGRGKHERVIFCTAKRSGRRSAEQTLELFGQNGYRGTSLSLSAKDRVCLSPGKACHGDDCPYARGYYDRLPAAMQAALAVPNLSQDALQALAVEHNVCPYELAWDLLPWVDVVIADVHYLYSFSPALAPAAGDGGRRSTVLLDEAHNLPERARRMYSARLHRRRVLAARRELPAGPVRRAVERFNRALLDVQKAGWEGEYSLRDDLPDKLQLGLYNLVSVVGEVMAKQPLALVRHTALMDVYFEALQFQRCLENWGPEYRCEFSLEDKVIRVRLNCLDAGRLLAERASRVHAAIAFSATLSPFPWARESLGLPEDTVCFRASSPFSRRQLQVSVASDIDTRYQQRSASLPMLAARLRQWLEAVPGNCLLFFPSYRYLQDCLVSLGDVPGRTVQAQQAGESDAEREALLELLSRRRDLALFAVLGGSLGEGVDLPGDLLSSVVIVGVGMPGLDHDSRARQLLFQQRYGDGFAYAFLYPGMQRVAQAIGRVVRTSDDQGRALLVDTRFAQPGYRELLPPWWDYSAPVPSAPGAPDAQDAVSQAD
ncbi:ATP-dependent DNA helicase [Parahaliea maris]|uniref:ATP-dependent DNA helicase n=1 Tax=Parahaliea maris TaxID=2716870 RepID=A0A5C9A1C9_9GAMM|nr:ATP-dependent DNA helicase [Parahaliea maris]TXS93889.1 ATP-dependent DNA helicase [Parahaliea maris]